MDEVFVPQENLLAGAAGPEESTQLPEQRALRHHSRHPRALSGTRADRYIGVQLIGWLANYSAAVAPRAFLKCRSLDR